MKIDGMSLSEYISWVLFVDSFVDIIENEEPEMSDKVIKPGKDLMDTVSDFFKEHKVDPMVYVDERVGMDVIRNLNRFWKGKLTVEDLAKFDKNAISTLALQSRGHGVAIDDETRVEKFLKQNDVTAPTASDIGVEFDHRPSVSAYRALEAVKE